MRITKLWAYNYISHHFNFSPRMTAFHANAVTAHFANTTFRASAADQSRDSATFQTERFLGATGVISRFWGWN